MRTSKGNSIFACAAVVCAALFSAPSFACDRDETLTAIDPALATDVARDPALCRLAMDKFGFDYGAAQGAAAKIEAYFGEKGCRVDRSYLQMSIAPSTPICKIQDYVRFI